jgi:hypothetical protein
MRRINCAHCGKSILTPIATGQVLCGACEDAPTWENRVPDSDEIQTEPYPKVEDDHA